MKKTNRNLKIITIIISIISYSYIGLLSNIAYAKNILAVHNQMRAIIIRRATGAALTRSWDKIFFSSMDVLIDSLQKVNYEIDTLEISADGERNQFADLNSSGEILTWSNNFMHINENARRQIITNSTVIYLSGCLTGLPKQRLNQVFSVARMICNYTKLTTFGTKGYFCGLYANNTEQCFKCPHPTIDCSPYGGLLDNGCGCKDLPTGYCNPPMRIGEDNQTKRDVWQKNIPNANDLKRLQKFNLKEPLFVFDNNKEKNIEIVNNINEILKSDTISFPFPNLSLAPSFSISISENGKNKIYDVYANNSILVDRETKLTYLIQKSMYKVFKQQNNKLFEFIK